MCYVSVAGSIQHVFWDPNSGFHYEQYAAPHGINPPAGQPGPRVRIPNAAFGTPAVMFTGAEPIW
jgi:hypothetical protein